jgi:hypothetical protein
MICAPIGAQMPIMLFADMGEQEVYVPTRE